MADITVTINGTTSVREVEELVAEKILQAASQAVMSAGEEHLEMSRENVKFAYRYGEPKISLMYAWALIPKAVQEAQTDEENLAMARRIQQERVGMIRSGDLLRGIQMGNMTKNRLSVHVDLLSKAPYSKNLEWGVLFDKTRRGKQRRFFTRHLQLHTIPNMIKHLYRNLGSDY